MSAGVSAVCAESGAGHVVQQGELLAEGGILPVSANLLLRLRMPDVRYVKITIVRSVLI